MEEGKEFMVGGGKGCGVAKFRIGEEKGVMRFGADDGERGHMLKNDGVTHRFTMSMFTLCYLFPSSE